MIPYQLRPPSDDRQRVGKRQHTSDTERSQFPETMAHDRRGRGTAV